MENINSVVVTGNLTRDIGDKDFGYVGGENGVAKLSISIAVNKSVKRNGEWTSEPCYFDVEMWGKLAESMKKYLHKGKGIAVAGRLDQDRWEKDGQKKSRVYINATSVQLLGGGKDKDEGSAVPSETNDLGFKEDIVF
jgi:single-strand DNA-binding protein